MQQPQISILLPFRDAAPTLAAALASVARQTFAAWECVLVDDGSRDGGAAIASAAAEKDPRFRLLSRPAAGLVPALNAGLAACTAPLIARMDADDLMHRERLLCQMRALEASPALAGVGCHVRLFPRRDMSDGLRAYERWLGSIDGEDAVRRDAFVECPLVHPTLMLRREVLAAFRYPECDWPEDYDLVLRLLGDGRRLGVVPRRLLSWRDSPGRLTRTGARYRLDRITACKAHYLAQQFLAAGDAYVLWGYGSTGRSLRRALLAHGKRPAYVVDLHPRRIGQSIGGAAVVHPDELRSLPRLPLVASVAGEQPRREIRDFLGPLGFVEGRDFVCAA